MFHLHNVWRWHASRALEVCRQARQGVDLDVSVLRLAVGLLILEGETAYASAVQVVQRT